MKTSIAAATAAAVLALPGAALAHPADVPQPPVFPTYEGPGATHVLVSAPSATPQPPVFPTYEGPGATHVLAPPKATTTSHVSAPSSDDGTGTLAVVLIAGGAALAAAGTGFAAGRVRLQRQQAA
jgi:hypothetical protein